MSKSIVLLLTCLLLIGCAGGSPRADRPLPASPSERFDRFDLPYRPLEQVTPAR